jgi:hypothetical protein
LMLPLFYIQSLFLKIYQIYLFCMLSQAHIMILQVWLEIYLCFVIHGDLQSWWLVLCLFSELMIFGYLSGKCNSLNLNSQFPGNPLVPQRPSPGLVLVQYRLVLYFFLFCFCRVLLSFQITHENGGFLYFIHNF